MLVVFTTRFVLRVPCVWPKPFNVTLIVADDEADTCPLVPPVWNQLTHAAVGAASVKEMALLLVVESVMVVVT